MANAMRYEQSVLINCRMKILFTDLNKGENIQIAYAANFSLIKSLRN